MSNEVLQGRMAVYTLRYVQNLKTFLARTFD